MKYTTQQIKDLVDLLLATHTFEELSQKYPVPLYKCTNFEQMLGRLAQQVNAFSYIPGHKQKLIRQHLGILNKLPTVGEINADS